MPEESKAVRARRIFQKETCRKTSESFPGHDQARCKGHDIWRKQPICKADSQLLQQKHFIRKTSRQNINQKSEMHL